MKLLATRPRRMLVGGVAALSLLGSGAALADGFAPGPREVVYNIPTAADGSVLADPFLAGGVALGKDVPVYSSAGTGPAARNTLAPAGTPERYIDYEVLAALYPDFAPTDAERGEGLLPPGVTLTEAQGLNNMARIKENVESVGLTLEDLAFMRIYVDNVPGEERADYAGWNRAYRRFVANVDRTTGEVIESYAPVVLPNATRPARSNIEVATLPVEGWLIEIEVVATY